MTRRLLAALIFATLFVPMPALAQSSSSEKPFVVEYYYKAKWGHADEFLKLFKKNHYPLLRKEVEMGRMVKVWMDQPRYHTTEDGRWDFRVTIVFKNATVANESFDEDAIKKQLWPDQETYIREEQRRFEILDAHWDLPIRNVDRSMPRTCFPYMFFILMTSNSAQSFSSASASSGNGNRIFALKPSCDLIESRDTPATTAGK